MTPKKLGATGRVTPKVKYQRHDPIKNRLTHGTANSGAQALDLRNSAKLLRQRQDRLIGRIASSPDAPARWALVVAKIVQLLDDPEKVHRLLGSVAEIPPDRVQLYAKIAGA